MMKVRQNISVLRRAVCSLLACGVSTPVLADESGPVLDEVTVTSQRRSESIQTVPIAVSAFGVADLEERNVVDALGVMQYVPNVVSHNNVGVGSANSYYIRGLGNGDSGATVDAPVGTYVDEIYVARQGVNNVSLFDVERVEVMRGPQGTLFGRNTTGGAVSIVMARPAEERAGFVEVSAGRYGQLGVRGSVDLPLSERVRTKISGYWSEDDGYVRNITTGEDLNAEGTEGIRLAAAIDFSDSVRWDLSGMYTASTTSNILNFECQPGDPARCDGRYASTGLRVNNRGANQVAPLALTNGKGTLPLGTDATMTLLSSNLSFEIGGATINAITGYVQSELDFLIDFFDGRAAPSLTFAADPVTGLPTRYNVNGNVVLDRPVLGLEAGGFVLAQKADTDQFTQEVKGTGSLFSDRLKYVAGVYYFDERSDQDMADVLTSTTTRVPSLVADRIVAVRTQAKAAYMQLDYSLDERWSITAGVRFTDEEKQFRFTDNRAICQATPLPATCIDTRNFRSVDVDLNPATPPIDIPLDQRVKIWTPRFVVNFAPSDSLLFYASATRGFKSGSQAARATAVRLLLPVGPEKLWSYELGARTEWLDRRLRLNVTAFNQENEDFQAGTAFVNPTTGALTFVTRNLADLENRGVEIELLAKPIDPLTISFNLGYQDIEFKVDSGAPSVDQFGFLSAAAQLAECRAALAGRPSPLNFVGTAVSRAQGYCSGIITNAGELAKGQRAPEIMASLGLSWEFALGNGTLTPSVFAIYTDDQETGTNNLSGYINAAGVANFAGDGRFVTGSFSAAHTIYNASLTYKSNDGRWTAALYCDNCTDETYGQSTLSNYTFLNPPRSYGARIKWDF